MQPVYTAGPLATGVGFVLDLPLHFSGVDPPSARDLRRPREIVIGVALILGFTAAGVLWFFAREHRYGRFAPLTTAIDETWLAEHIFKYPAEVVAAAWDENVGTAEVTSLIARMVDDGKLRSSVGKGTAKSAEMTLHLLVDRAALQGHERVLVDKLFVDGGTVTSTRIVRAHYKKTGFTPSAEIEPQLNAAVDAMLPTGRAPWRFPVLAPVAMTLGLLLIAWSWFQGHPGALRGDPADGRAHRRGLGRGLQVSRLPPLGIREALLCLLPVLAIALGASLYLWFYAGTGRIELPTLTVIGLVAVTLGCIHSATNALKSRRHRAAIAFRKTLTAGRAYFIDQLRKDEPALRDEWYPWLLAFELTPQMDAWSTARAGTGSRPRGGSGHAMGSSSATSSAGGTWTGFGGGRSGGAGGGASWEAAVSGMAAGVSAPSSSRSSGGSGGGGSSGGGSSGGGGGGGW